MTNKTQNTTHEEQASYFYRNGLTIVFMILFLSTLLGQALTGWKVYNETLADSGIKPILFQNYIHTGHFFSATFENFESEFLQMALYVVFTISLRQKGSAESKKLFEKEEVDREPRVHIKAPWPVKKGGWVKKIYCHSLSLCFFMLFLISWYVHFLGSKSDYNFEQRLDNQPTVTSFEYLTKPEFWFETFQNWQSEFISIAAIVFFTIYLRQKGSPESKPVDAPHMETGK